MPFNVTCGMVQNPWCDPRPYDERCFCRSTTSHVSKVVNLSCKRMFYSIESAIRFQGLTFFVFFLCLSTMQFPGGPAAEVSLEKKLWTEPKKEFAHRMCARRPTSAMGPNRVFCVHQPSGILVVAGCVSVVCRWWWCNVRCCATWCHVVGCEVMK